MFYIENFFSDDRYLYHLLTSESCLCGRYLHAIVECMTITLQPTLTLGYMKSDIEISGSIASTMSFTTHFYTHAIFDAGRDFDVFFYQSIVILLSMTGTTFFDYLLSSTTTAPTGTLLFHSTKYCLYSLTHTTTSTTTLTGCCFSSFSTAGITGSTSLKFYFSTISTDRILERDTHTYLDIISDIGACPPTSTTSSESS